MRRWASMTVVAGLAFVGCSSQPDDGRVSYLILQQPAIGVLDAYLDETVSIDGDCPLLLLGPDGSTGLQRAAWPDGTVFDPSLDIIILSDGRQIRDGDLITGGGGSENFGGNEKAYDEKAYDEKAYDEKAYDEKAYDDIFQPDSMTSFSTSCRQSEVQSTEWFIIAPDSIQISTP
jgi:hypothetical protein